MKFLSTSDVVRWLALHGERPASESTVRSWCRHGLRGGDGQYIRLKFQPAAGAFLIAEDDLRNFLAETEGLRARRPALALEV